MSCVRTPESPSGLRADPVRMREYDRLDGFPERIDRCHATVCLGEA